MHATSSRGLLVVLSALQLAVCIAQGMEGTTHEVGWGDAAWMTTMAIALVIVLVGITFFTILILASMSLAKIQVLQRFFWNFLASLIASFLNLFLVFGAFFAFPAVVINSFVVTALYVIDRRGGFASSISNGKVKVVPRFFLYLFIAVLSTIIGACLIKYTPGVLHERGEVPPLDWQKDFHTWEGLGGWLLVNLMFGSISLIAGSIYETWVFRKDALEFVKHKAE